MDHRVQKLCRLLFALLLVSSVVGIANADMSNDVKNSIAGGVDLFIIRFVNGCVDSIVEDGRGVDTGSGADSVALDSIFAVATYTPDPFSMNFLDVFKNTMRSIAYDFWWYFIMFSIILVLLTYLIGINESASMYNLSGIDVLHALKMVITVIVGGVAVLAFEMAFVWIVLFVNNEVTQSVMMGSLNAIAFTPDNVPLYAVMGFAYAALGLCFEYRVLVILFFYSISVIIGMLVLFPPTRVWAINAHLYFIQITFFQFFVVLWYSFCIFCLQGVGVDGYATYILMVLISIWMSYKFIFKIDFLRSVGMATRIILIKKL